MSFRWTDTLVEPLRGLGQQRDWRRVEPSRKGGWLLLADEGETDTAWYVAGDGTREPRRLDPLEDPGLAGTRERVREWLDSGHGVELLAWRVGRRAVFRVTGTASGSWFCKVFHRDRAVRDRWAALADDPASRWRSPRVFEWDAEAKWLTLEACSGQTLNERWKRGRGSPEDGNVIADLLEWLRRQSIPDGLPVHDVGDEISLLDKSLDRFERTVRRPPGRASALTGRVQQALETCDEPRRLLCHRDLHDKQLLLEQVGHGGRLLDLDLLAAGPPALDVGNVLAHIRLRALAGTPIPWHAIASTTAGRTVASRRIHDSLAAWTASALLRLALLYALRRRRRGLVSGLLDSAERALDRTGEWKSIL